jgi:hypothetical protein
MSSLVMNNSLYQVALICLVSAFSVLIFSFLYRIVSAFSLHSATQAITRPTTQLMTRPTLPKRNIKTRRNSSRHRSALRHLLIRCDMEGRMNSFLLQCDVMSL